jgi:CheY-like chemotaxis protein
MARILLIEHNPADIHEATSVLQKLGIQDVHVITSALLAIEYLRDIAEKRQAIPDVVVLDLDFGKESGFEVLRFWKSTPELKSLRMIVWTVMGALEKQMSELFGVHQVVSKHEGAKGLQRVLQQITDAGTSAIA